MYWNRQDFFPISSNMNHRSKINHNLVTGYLFSNDNMNISKVTASPEEFDHLIRMSIIRALKWLEQNVLCDPNKGYYLRQRLNNFSFDRDTERYLRSSYKYWSRRLKINNTPPLLRRRPNQRVTANNNTNRYMSSDDIRKDNIKRDSMMSNQRVIYSQMDEEIPIYSKEFTYDQSVDVSDLTPELPMGCNENFLNRSTRMMEAVRNQQVERTSSESEDGQGVYGHYDNHIYNVSRSSNNYDISHPIDLIVRVDSNGNRIAALPILNREGTDVTFVPIDINILNN